MLGKMIILKKGCDVWDDDNVKKSCCAWNAGNVEDDK